MTPADQIELSPPLIADVRAQAKARPTARAVIDETSDVSYAEFVRRFDSQADVLREAGLPRGGRVALVAENSAAFLIAACAVWEAGGVLATIYPSTAPADLEYTLRNADPSVVLVDAATVGAVREAITAAGLDVPVARIDGEHFECEPAAAPTLPTTESDAEPFLICYSSGTTSRPKAIMLSHDAIRHGARTFGSTWHITGDDRVIVCLPMAWLFGLSTMSMTTLAAGGTVLSLRRASPALVAETTERHGATVIGGVTTIFTKLVEHLSQTRRDMSTLRFAVSGGEPRNEVAFARFEDLAGIPVHDNYCSSECFPLVTYDPVADPRPRHGSAGKLVDQAQLRIVSPDGSDVPAGEVGEGLAFGPGVMQGYWGDPDQTRAALTDEGWYRTNDLVRIDEDGYVYVVGRLSDMIIRGGSNVSPAEVERAVRLHPSVADVSVVGLPDPIYGEEVVAAVMLRADTDLDVSGIQDAVRSELASFKVPTRIVRMEALPYSATTGKVDRKQVVAQLRAVESADRAQPA